MTQQQYNKQEDESEQLMKMIDIKLGGGLKIMQVHLTKFIGGKFNPASKEPIKGITSLVKLVPGCVILTNYNSNLIKIKINLLN